MNDVALPLSQQIILVVVFPPIGAALVWLLSRGAANVFENDNPSKGSLSWLRRSFWVQLAILYCLGFGMLMYVHLFR